MAVAKTKPRAEIVEPAATMTPREWDIWHTAFVTCGFNSRVAASEADRQVWKYRDHLASDEPSLLKNPDMERV